MDAYVIHLPQTHVPKATDPRFDLARPVRGSQQWWTTRWHFGHSLQVSSEAIHGVVSVCAKVQLVYSDGRTASRLRPAHRSWDLAPHASAGGAGRRGPAPPAGLRGWYGVAAADTAFAYNAAGLLRLILYSNRGAQPRGSAPCPRLCPSPGPSLGWGPAAQAQHPGPSAIWGLLQCHACTDVPPYGACVVHRPPDRQTGGACAWCTAGGASTWARCAMPNYCSCNKNSNRQHSAGDRRPFPVSPASLTNRAGTARPEKAP